MVMYSILFKYRRSALLPCNIDFNVKTQDVFLVCQYALDMMYINLYN